MVPPDPAQRSAFRRGVRRFPLSGAAAALAMVTTLVATANGCYSTGDGTAPPLDSIYFPVGLAVSPGGHVLYVANSDFDLQYNGGTLQSYDLTTLRQHTVATILDPNNALIRPNLVYGPVNLDDGGDGGVNNCQTNVPIIRSDGQRQVLGETCAPPVQSSAYVKDSVVLGAFATDVIISRFGTRIFTPVRGDASLTWADITFDYGIDQPVSMLPPSLYTLNCGTRVDGRCDAAHHAGTDPNEPNNSRHLTMPGEPFGIAESDDGASIVLTHQTETETSLFATGFDPLVSTNLLPPDLTNLTPDQITSLTTPSTTPSMQYILSGSLPQGGIGVASIPHDPLALTCPVGTPAGTSCIRPSFLETNRTSAEIDLLRYYPDDGTLGGASQPSATMTSTLPRPFLMEENKFALTANAGGTDTRDVVIDPTPRIRCEASVPAANPIAMPPRTDDDVAADMRACSQLPARFFAASRSPASLIIGEVGAPSSLNNGAYDPDRLIITGNLPLSTGPSSVYLAPIVDAEGNYALRVFITCFDSSTIYVYDPDAGAIENVLHVGAGPFAMAFDPFSMQDVANRVRVPPSTANARLVTEPDGTTYTIQPEDLKSYRFAYVASFTDSYLQVLDLDNSLTGPDATMETFETVVFTLGAPSIPLGSQ
jgi:hypothetical protein